MRFRSSIRKVHGVGPHREFSTRHTWESVSPHLRRVGVTRVANITGLDRIGIPVFNAVVPRSQDLISVYNGKGDTPLDARTSAVMEAVERHSAWLPQRPDTIASVTELRFRPVDFVDPAEVNIKRSSRCDDDTPISWVRGWDVMNERSLLVPLYLAGYYLNYFETPPFQISTTNGLASGNSIEEATCHALCELIERDDWTMAELISNRLSRALTVGHLGLAPSESLGASFRELNPSIDADTLPAPHQVHLQRFRDAGLQVELKDITSETGIPSVLAVVVEDLGPTFSHLHQGIGTHPDAGVAAMRAITEVAQSRVVDIQAMREDIALPDEEVQNWALHVKRSAAFNPKAWAYRPSNHRRSFAQMASHPSDDIMADLTLMLDRLRAQGMTRAVVVDLSPPDVPAKVVRVVVPGIESWAIDRSRLGWRATRRWAQALESARRACGGESASRREEQGADERGVAMNEASMNRVLG